MTKTELTNLKELVIHILETNPVTRDDDSILYLEVCKSKKADVGKLSFEDVTLHRKDYGLPVPASVHRARRKAQEERSDLVGTIRSLRKSQEAEYIDFALDNKKKKR